MRHTGNCLGKFRLGCDKGEGIREEERRATKELWSRVSAWAHEPLCGRIWGEGVACRRGGLPEGFKFGLHTHTQRERERERERERDRHRHIHRHTHVAHVHVYIHIHRHIHRHTHTCIHTKTNVHAACA